jgi:predicted permease
MWIGYVPLELDPTPDMRVLAFTAAVAGLTGALVGLAPAWHLAQTDPASTLQQSTRTVRRSVGPLGKLLVSMQVALSLVLVMTATLLVRSLKRLLTADPGYRREGVLVMQLFPQAGHEKLPNRLAYYRELAQKLSELPAVKAVSYSHMGPALFYEYKVPVSMPSLPMGPVQAVEDFVGPGFFHMIGMRVLEGREFDWHDNERAKRVAVISASLAQRLIPGESPVGRRIDIEAEPDHKDMEIVGVVNSASLWQAKSQEPVAIYIPLMQESKYNQPLLDIRTAGNPGALAPAVQRVLESMGHHYSLRTQTLEDRANRFLAEDRMVALLSAFFGGLALLLASVGLYGVMSHTVTRRTPEIGVRVALGAQRSAVQGLIMREVGILVLIGVAVGVPVTLAVSRIFSGMLFGLTPNDPPTLAISTGILVGVALFAGYLPARRASRIDPIVALRYE